jgi:hypothetical protein
MGHLLGWGRFGVFLGGNALALAALYLLLFSPVRDFLADQQSRIEQIGPRLEQARSTLARNQALASLDAAELSAGTQRFIQGDSVSLLNADLLTRLRHLGDQHGVSFSSVTTLSQREWRGRKLVGAKIEFSGKTREIAEFVAATENGRSYLFITRAQLSPLADRDSFGGTMTANLEIYGVSGWLGACTSDAPPGCG